MRGPSRRKIGAAGRLSRLAAGLAAAAVLGSGCAHSRPPTVERRFGDTIVRGPAYTSAAYRAVMELSLSDTIAAHERALEVPPSGPVDPRFVAALTDPDPYALFLALDASPDDRGLLELARRRQASLNDCGLAIAIAARGEHAVAELGVLSTACPRATPLAIRYAIANHDEASLPALARLAAPSTDFVVYDAAFEAFLHLRDVAGMEAFVASRQDDAVFLARALERARATDDVAMRAAILAPLATTPRFARQALAALLAADRSADARSAALRLAPTTSDDRLAFAELAIAAGAPERALAWLETAYADGASTRATALRADALDALGRADEAARLRASLLAGTAGAAARERDD